MDTPKVHLTRWGTSGKTVVMVHGGVQGGDVGGATHFAAQEGLGARGWRLVVPDRPGHGQSPAPGRPDDAEADGAWVAELLGDGAHLVGHSFGGAVALAAARMRPAAVRSLTLIEPAMLPLAIARPEMQAFLGQQMQLLMADLPPAELARRFATLLGIPDAIRGGSSPEVLERMGHAMKQLRLPTPDSLSEGLSVVKSHGIPLWVVSGGWSPAFDVLCEIVADLGGGTHFVATSPHHFPQLAFAGFNDMLVDFMTAAEG